MARLVSCPYCKKQVEYSTSNPFRPFCSKRCKDIDLGDWADERFRVPSADPVQEDLQLPQDESGDDSGDDASASPRGHLLH